MNLKKGIWIAMLDREEIGNHYSKYFQMINVNTEELRKIAYKLRYRVFHEEYGYHNLGNPLNNNMEIDDYDEYSLHSLLFHKPSNQAIGYIRLIPQTKKHNKSLPIKKYYGESFDFSKTSLDRMPEINIGELSRMAIISAFRKRLSDNYYLNQEHTNQSENITRTNKRYPVNYLPMCLISAAIHFLFMEDIEYSFAMIETRFAVLLRHFGVQCDQIGKPVECFGIRAPYVFYRENTYRNLTPEFRSLFDKISSELAEQSAIKNTLNINAR
ncbi:PEP-CTERM/exosortase system-associated acyltransferase [Methylobacter sp. BBA5.1]|uniref:PEP-CTERM/exosortase system-associated acyltransferase n=1 Tax=Methylobacter sp. BBA5.1 TaxID=1495064 RepID=UPI000AED7CCE|nr:PEP-CTERM/exosortase system-associated acyltransferase [Methylobacter sp. BBA5.1]